MTQPLTAEVKARKVLARKQVETFLLAVYPNVFDRKTPALLKIGIHKDIKSRHTHIKTTPLSSFLGKWTKRYEYLVMDRTGPRVDLDGNATPPYELDKEKPAVCSDAPAGSPRETEKYAE